MIWLKKVGHYKTKYQEQFWSCKCTTNSNLNKKEENKKKWKHIWKKKKQKKWKKQIIRFGNIEIEKQKFHQDKSTILIENIDVNKIIVSNKFSFGEKGFKCSVNNKDAKKLDLYAYFFQR